MLPVEPASCMLACCLWFQTASLLSLPAACSADYLLLCCLQLQDGCQVTLPAQFKQNACCCAVFNACLLGLLLHVVQCEGCQWPQECSAGSECVSHKVWRRSAQRPDIRASLGSLDRDGRWACVRLTCSIPLQSCVQSVHRLQSQPATTGSAPHAGQPVPPELAGWPCSRLQRLRMRSCTGLTTQGLRCLELLPDLRFLDARWEQHQFS